MKLKVLLVLVAMASFTVAVGQSHERCESEKSGCCGKCCSAQQEDSEFSKILEKIKANAKKYYGDSEEKMARYVEGQCRYYKHIVKSRLKLAEKPEFNYNYALLYATFCSGMKLDDFIFLVPEAERSFSLGNSTIMSCGAITFTFENNHLVR